MPKPLMLLSMKWRGFTVVELIITITIMGILLTLAVVNISSTQVDARDTERQSDVESIVNHLEVFYKNGAPNATTTGRYPSTQMLASGSTSLKAFLPDLDPVTATAPGAADVNATFKAATNNTQTTTGVAPQPTNTEYIYQPIQTNGDLCTAESQECRKFNIYYRAEVGNTVMKVMSKNQ